jgi:chemotaxis-related protein WspD
MNSTAPQVSSVEPAELDDCWNRIGVRGDRSCTQLTAHIHCRNCPVYSAAARTLLETPAWSDYTHTWTDHVAQPTTTDEADTHSVMIFRVGAEWLAVSTHLCAEVVSSRTVHSLPHRRSGAVLGVANIRGVLRVCVSLAAILHVTAAGATDQPPQGSPSQRLLVLSWPDGTVAVPVDEVHGVHRFRDQDSQEVPALLARAQSAYTKAVLCWSERSVGVLDEHLLGHTITRSLA